MQIHMSGIAMRTLAASDWNEEDIKGVGGNLKAHVTWILKDLPYSYNMESWYLTKKKDGDWHEWQWHTDIRLDELKERTNVVSQ